MNEDVGRVQQAEPGSRASTETVCAVSALPGFDPSRGLHILQHSLGVDQHGRGSQYRNHFATGPGSTDYEDCNALTAAGLMVVRRQPPHYGGMDMFFVTDAGRAYVAGNSPPAPKLTRSQKRYRDWLEISDVTGESFIAFCRRRDSNSDPQGENSRSEVECEASQSGAVKQAHRPTPTPLVPPIKDTLHE